MENLHTDENLNIPLGLSAIYLPELEDVSPIGNKTPVSAEETLARMNRFLAGLNNNGIEVKAVIPVDVLPERKRGGMVRNEEPKTMLIVHR